MAGDENLDSNPAPSEATPAKFGPRHTRPWTPEEDALLGTKPDAVLAAEFHRGAQTVRQRRLLLGLPVLALKAPAWKPEEISLLGTDTDEAIASRLGRTVAAVMFRRFKLSI